MQENIPPKTGPAMDIVRGDVGDTKGCLSGPLSFPAHCPGSPVFTWLRGSPEVVEPFPAFFATSLRPVGWPTGRTCLPLLPFLQTNADSLPAQLDHVDASHAQGRGTATQQKEPGQSCETNLSFLQRPLHLAMVTILWSLLYSKELNEMRNRSAWSPGGNWSP